MPPCNGANRNGRRLVGRSSVTLPAWALYRALSTPKGGRAQARDVEIPPKQRVIRLVVEARASRGLFAPFPTPDRYGGGAIPGCLA